MPAAALRFKPAADLLASQGVKAPAGKSPTLWVSTNGQLSATTVQVGATDATYTEILSPALPEGTQVVTRAVTAASTATATPAATNNPLMPSRPTPRR